MTTFQKDLLLTINSSHEKYISKMTDLLNEESILSNLSLHEAEQLINYIKDFNSQINILCSTVDKICNVKKQINLEEKIENELFIKMLPIMSIYRTLLHEKYKVKNINEQD